MLVTRVTEVTLIRSFTVPLVQEPTQESSPLGENVRIQGLSRYLLTSLDKETEFGAKNKSFFTNNNGNECLRYDF